MVVFLYKALNKIIYYIKSYWIWQPLHFYLDAWLGMVEHFVAVFCCFFLAYMGCLAFHYYLCQIFFIKFKQDVVCFASVPEHNNVLEKQDNNLKLSLDKTDEIVSVTNLGLFWKVLSLTKVWENLLKFGNLADPEMPLKLALLAR